MKLDPNRFQQIMQVRDSTMRRIQLDEFCAESKLGITATEIIAIAQMVCAVAEVVCPIIEDI
jgi:hypothetical protein